MTTQSRINKIYSLLDHAEGEEADALFKEVFALEDALYAEQCADEEAADLDHIEFVRQAYSPQHHRL